MSGSHVSEKCHVVRVCMYRCDSFFFILPFDLSLLHKLAPIDTDKNVNCTVRRDKMKTVATKVCERRDLIHRRNDAPRYSSRPSTAMKTGATPELRTCCSRWLVCLTSSLCICPAFDLTPTSTHLYTLEGA